ncbi:hypothetical protein SAMN05216584_11319 [Selenomonas sp. WCT3]|uniref:hypothetical protein n=1 Tax=Selenomonas sp. WCT3 TaxID=3158785 RepID=UPI000886DB69|nr:hypothetical protein SAMN05216584_11319 [Selenomonas ruminantium]
MEEQQEKQAVQEQEWTCSCGHKNMGNFCEMCGKPRAAAEPATDVNGEVSEDTQPQPVITPEMEAAAQAASQEEVPPAPQPQQPPMDATQSMPPVRELAPMPQQQPWQQGMPQQPMVQPQ